MTDPSLFSSSLFFERLKQALGSDLLDFQEDHGDSSIQIAKDRIAFVANILKENPALCFEQMMDLTCVDYLKQGRKPRFQMVYHFLSLSQKNRLRVKADLNEEDMSLPTISHLWLAANWYERECYDMLGVHFLGHPNLKRILLYEGFEGHPLRKDYPILKEQPLLPLRKIEERYDYMGYKQPKP